MLKRIQINRNSPENKALKEIYDNAFPYDEKVPYYDFFDLLDTMGGEFTAYYDGENLLGMFVGFRMKKYNYGGYLVVDEKFRGKGYGQKIVTDILDRYSKDNPFLVDCESPFQTNAPNLEIRKRRHAFYLRNGMKDTGRYITVHNVDYIIMTTSKEPVPQEDIDEAYVTLKPFIEKIPASEKEI